MRYDIAEAAIPPSHDSRCPCSSCKESWRRIRARKPHECCVCGHTIPAGSTCYARASVVAPGPIGRPFYDEWLCVDDEWRVTA